MEVPDSPGKNARAPSVNTLKNVLVDINDENEMLRRELEEVEKRLEDSESQREVQQWHLRTEIETVRHQLKQQIEKNFGLQQKLKDKDVDLTELLTQAAEL